MGSTMGGTSLAYQMKAPTWNLTELFKQFDTDHDGYLSIAELKRAFRAIGLKKRIGPKASMDLEMFMSFDTVRSPARIQLTAKLYSLRPKRGSHTGLLLSPVGAAPAEWRREDHPRRV